MEWIEFFNDHGIEYVTRGPNVARGNVNIACPWCGNDPSHHMGVSLDKEAFGCWRGMDHKGKAPHRLIQALLGCSYNQAKVIAKQYSNADPETLDEALEALVDVYDADNRSDKPAQRDKLKYPPEFREIKKTGLSRRFWQYLKDRGFRDVETFASLYDLKCASSGKYTNRIIIPVYMDGKLSGWTSRAIGVVHDAPRYLALSEDDGGLVNVFHSLLNWDEIQEGGDLLLIVEGPFDALKLDYYSIKFEDEGYVVRSTCTFGTSMSDEQAMMIAEVSKKFKRAVLLYDPGATEAIFLASNKLMHTNVECGFLEADVEDPGAMTEEQVHSFVTPYLEAPRKKRRKKAKNS